MFREDRINTFWFKENECYIWWDGVRYLRVDLDQSLDDKYIAENSYGDMYKF